MLERDLQVAANKILRDLGVAFFHAERGRGAAARHQHGGAWPDLMIFPGGGKAFFVELKNTCGTMSRAQVAKVTELFELGYSVYEARTVSAFIDVLKAQKCWRLA